MKRQTGDTDPADRRLARVLRSLGSVLVAFSGGVDSTFLLVRAREVLGQHAVHAVIADSVTMPRLEFARAVAAVRSFGVSSQVIRIDDLRNTRFARNPVNRCYYCKHELFSRLLKIARARRLSYVCDGTNADDTKDIRFGMRAARELGVRSPLLEAGMGKARIRALSRARGLATWDKPSMACLSSRFVYGDPLTRRRIRAVERAEEALYREGLTQVRVRAHDTIARIEVPAAELPALLRPGTRKRIVTVLKSCGFCYVTVDLQGYRTGSMHEPVRKSGSR